MLQYNFFSWFQLNFLVCLDRYAALTGMASLRTETGFPFPLLGEFPLPIMSATNADRPGPSTEPAPIIHSVVKKIDTAEQELSNHLRH